MEVSFVTFQSGCHSCYNPSTTSHDAVSASVRSQDPGEGHSTITESNSGPVSFKYLSVLVPGVDGGGQGGCVVEVQLEGLAKGGKLDEWWVVARDGWMEAVKQSEYEV